MVELAIKNVQNGGFPLANSSTTFLVAPGDGEEGDQWSKGEVPRQAIGI